MKTRTLCTALAVFFALLLQENTCLATGGDEFAGSWRDMKSFSTITISKVEGYFIIDDGNQKTNAVYGDGVLKVPGRMGIVLATLKTPDASKDTPALRDKSIKLLMSSKEYTRLPGIVTPSQQDGGVELAKQIFEELRLLDSATDQWAIETNRKSGEKATPAQIRAYLKTGSRLYNALGDKDGPKDPLGNAYGPFIVDKIPKVNPATFEALSDVADASFWSPYK